MIAGMICSNCGRWHENERGKCPFCTPKREIIRRQKERPSSIEGGWIIKCEECGEEIKDWKWADTWIYRGPVPIHDCPQKKRPKLNR